MPLSGQVGHVNGTAAVAGGSVVLDDTYATTHSSARKRMSRNVLVRNAEALGGNNLLVNFNNEANGATMSISPQAGLNVDVEATDIFLKGDGGNVSYEILTTFKS